VETLLDVVRHRKLRSTVQQDLYYLVVVPVCSQDERGNVRSESRGVWRDCFPALESGTEKRRKERNENI
jgi:hypothetical protein